jgi:threonine/homoserine/homoserine lactone efflux protein
MEQHGKTDQGRAGQRVALLVAGTGAFWIMAILFGAEYDWPNRVRALFDLAALAGFGFALWQTFQLWRARQNDQRLRASQHDKGDT